ncbi:MAG: hypothetical protein ACLQJ7_02045 [Syntrophobacteraceae bacterium]
MTPETTTCKVAKIVDAYTVVINKGEANGVKLNQRFLLYAIGDEIFDPENNQSLGNLEIVKGTGRVLHVQAMMATIESDMFSSPSRSIRKVRRRISALSIWPQGDEEIEELGPSQRISFENPQVGDFAKAI